MRLFDSCAAELSDEYRGSGRYPLKCKTYRGVGNFLSAGDTQIPKCADPFTPDQYQDYIQIF
jgi:hypothetical protein